MQEKLENLICQFGTLVYQIEKCRHAYWFWEKIPTCTLISAPLQILLCKRTGQFHPAPLFGPAPFFGTLEYSDRTLTVTTNRCFNNLPSFFDCPLFLKSWNESHSYYWKWIRTNSKTRSKFEPHIWKLEPVCCKKRQKIVPDQLLVWGVGAGPLKDLKDSKLILNESKLHISMII